VRRFVLTGAPGAGKTSLLAELAGRGQRTVPEAATDLIADGQRRGVAEPEREPDFIARVVELQIARQQAATDGELWFFDRSPLCTLALARHLGRPLPPVLRAELDRIVTEHVYQPVVFFLEPPAELVNTPIRRIDPAGALEFGRLHVTVYERFGFQLHRIPVLPTAERAERVLAAI
jgi:predicted ATPase